jgi:type IV secretion system protein VirB4
VSLYQAFGLNDRQIGIISEAIAKREYYVTSSNMGNRLINLGLGKLELAFYGAGTSPQERNRVDDLKAAHGDKWVSYWLESKGLESYVRQWLEIERQRAK